MSTAPTRNTQKAPPRGHSAATAPAKRPRRAAGATRRPWVVSLPDWVATGSDQDFRSLLNGLIRLGNLMRGNQERFASYIGVSVPGFQILIALEVAPQSTVGQLAGRLEVSSQFITLETGKLIRQGLLEKRQNDLDRRSVVLDITAAGRQLLADVAPLRRQTNDRMFRSVSARKGAELLDIVTVLLADGHEAQHLLQGPQWRQRRAPSLGG